MSANAGEYPKFMQYCEILTLGDIVCILESMSSISAESKALRISHMHFKSTCCSSLTRNLPEGQKADQLDHFSKSTEVCNLFLNGLASLSDFLSHLASASHNRTHKGQSSVSLVLPRRSNRPCCCSCILHARLQFSAAYGSGTHEKSA